MPQLNQLAEVAWSQFFWLLLVLAIIYFGIAKAMVPKIQATMAARDARIAEDLAEAERARAAADATEEAYRERMNAARAEALKSTQAAKQDSARATEARVAEADAAIRARTEAAEARLREAAEAAMADIEQVAAEAAREMVARLAGLSVPPEAAARAVNAELVDG